MRRIAFVAALLCAAPAVAGEESFAALADRYWD